MARHHGTSLAFDGARQHQPVGCFVSAAELQAIKCGVRDWPTGVANTYVGFGWASGLSSGERSRFWGRVCNAGEGEPDTMADALTLDCDVQAQLAGAFRNLEYKSNCRRKETACAGRHELGVEAARPHRPSREPRGRTSRARLGG